MEIHPIFGDYAFELGVDLFFADENPPSEEEGVGSESNLVPDGVAISESGTTSYQDANSLEDVSLGVVAGGLAESVSVQSEPPQVEEEEVDAESQQHGAHIIWHTPIAEIGHLPAGSIVDLLAVVKRVGMLKAAVSNGYLTCTRNVTITDDMLVEISLILQGSAALLSSDVFGSVIQVTGAVVMIEGLAAHLAPSEDCRIDWEPAGVHAEGLANWWNNNNLSIPGICLHPDDYPQMTFEDALNTRSLSLSRHLQFSEISPLLDFELDAENWSLEASDQDDGKPLMVCFGGTEKNVWGRFVRGSSSTIFMMQNPSAKRVAAILTSLKMRVFEIYFGDIWQEDGIVLANIHAIKQTKCEQE